MTHFNQTMRALRQDRERVANLATCTVALLLAAWSAWLFFDRVTVFEVSRNARLEVRLTPQNIDAVSPSKVLSTRLEIGRMVKAGEVLMELDASVEQLKLTQAKARIAALDDRLAALDKEIRARGDAREQATAATGADHQAALHRLEVARLKAGFARDGASRLAELLKRGSISRVEAIRADNEARRLEAERDALASDIVRMEQAGQSARNSSGADIESLVNTRAMLSGERAETRALSEKLQADIRARTIIAPTDGTLADVLPLKAGSFVAEGQRLATIVPDGDLMIVAGFSPSATLGRVRPGQDAWLRLDSYPWSEYGTIKARVTGLASEIRNGLVQVEFAIVEVPDTGIVLGHGLPGQIEVAVDSTSPATLVLRAAGIYWSGHQVDGERIVATSEATP